jgi:hypothetical protein
MGSYAVFTGTDGNVNKDNAFEAPNTPNVKLEKMVITKFAGPGNILNVINGIGGTTKTGVKRVELYNRNGTPPFDEEFSLPDKESYPSYIEMN